MGGEIRVDWVKLDSVPGLREAPGKIGMTFLPGKWSHGIAGEHRRDLEADVSRLRDFHGVDEFLLLVENPELVHARVPTVADVMKAHSPI